VSVDWLAENLNHSDLIIVDCRFSLADPTLGQQQYLTGHIPGAHYVDLNQDLSSPVERHGGRHPLPNPKDFIQTLEAMGIQSGNNLPPSKVVAYDDSRFAFASRLWWLLRYFGHDHVAVLDGGFRQWQETGYTVTCDRPSAKTGHFVPQIRSDWIVDIQQLKALNDLPETVLIDSREAGRYRGDYEPIDPIAGHIPGAVNYPWQEVTNDHGLVRSPTEQTQRWAKLDLQQAKDIIVYCGSGVTACVNLLSLELAGVKPARLYPGSWSDWCSYLVDSE
jgi:thiosulfate/3-mercaptopyruvate sulfurtransferase